MSVILPKGRIGNAKALGSVALNETTMRYPRYALLSHGMSSQPFASDLKTMTKHCKNINNLQLNPKMFEYLYIQNWVPTTEESTTLLILNFIDARVTSKLIHWLIEQYDNSDHFNQCRKGHRRNKLLRCGSEHKCVLRCFARTLYFMHSALLYNLYATALWVVRVLSGLPDRMWYIAYS